MPDKVTVPDLTGLITRGALQQVEDAGLVLAVAHPDEPFQLLLESARWVVQDQDPLAGSMRYRGDTVGVFLRHEGGGEAGVREPRDPLPQRSSFMEEFPAPGQSIEQRGRGRSDTTSPTTGDALRPVTGIGPLGADSPD